MVRINYLKKDLLRKLKTLKQLKEFERLLKSADLIS